MNPAALILGASVVSGASGYIVTWLAGSVLGATDYTPFAVFWSALFLIVGALGGVQQEVTRAASSSGDASQPRPATTLARFALLVAAAVAAIVLAIGLGFASSAPWGSSTGSTVALAVGTASYCVVAVLAGALYGVTAWRALAFMIAVDGILRLIGVSIALAVTRDVAILAIVVVAPFPLAVAIVLPAVRSRLASALSLDVPAARLARNTAGTVVASAATAAIVSGYPFILAATSPGVAPETLAPVILAFTLTRAPIVIPLLALQSYLVVRFGMPGSHRVLATRIIAIVALASLALGALAAAVGPLAFRSFFGPEFELPPLTLFALVATAGLVGVLGVTGPLALARSAHAVYSGGLVAAAVVTTILLLVPGGLEARVALSLSLGPAVGIAVHAIGLARGARAR